MANQQKHIINGLDEKLENQRKRNKILRLLESRLIKNDVNFKKLCISLINKDSNLDKILSYINCYLGSNAVLRAETKRFIIENVIGWSKCVFITFTVKNEMSRTAIKNEFNRFECILSKDSYGNAYTRRNKRCRHFAVYEGDVDSSTRPHYHAIFEVPHYKSLNEFKMDVRDRWTLGNIDYKHVYNSGTLLPYLFKHRTKHIQNFDLLEYFHF